MRRRSSSSGELHGSPSSSSKRHRIFASRLGNPCLDDHTRLERVDANACSGLAELGGEGETSRAIGHAELLTIRLYARANDETLKRWNPSMQPLISRLACPLMKALMRPLDVQGDHELLAPGRLLRRLDQGVLDLRG